MVYLKKIVKNIVY